MLITCTTRGCLQQTEAKLDRKTQEVICEACGNPINGITAFMKKSLSDCGQVLRHNGKSAFMALCKKCNQQCDMYIKDEKAYCKNCDSQVLLSPAFFSGLKQKLAKESEEDSE